MEVVKNIIRGLIVFIFCGTIHEFAHAFAAYILSDNTAKKKNRMNINPLSHIDPFGTLLFPIIAGITQVPIIGWMKPVPFDPYSLKNPSRDQALIALAGPLSNLFQAAFAI